MSVTTRPLPPAPRDGRLSRTRLVAAAMVTFVAVSLLKPWTWTGGLTASSPAPAPARTAVAAPPTTPAGAIAEPRAGAGGALPAAPGVDFDWGAAATALALRDAWGVATLVDSGVQRRDIAGDARPGSVVLAVQAWREVSRATLGLDPRANHGPWITHPPVVVWPADSRPILAIALTAPATEPPGDLDLWLDDGAGGRHRLALRELGTGRPEVRLLLAASPDQVRSETAWPAGTYRLELAVAGHAAALTIDLLAAAPTG